MLFRIIILYCSLSVNTVVIAQNIVLVDLSTKEPVSYALIVFKAKQQGQYAGKDGVFVIPPGSIATDSIYVHALGYRDLRTTISDLQDTIFLQVQSYMLESITVLPEQKSKLYNLGFLKKKKESFITYGIEEEFIPFILAVYIPKSRQNECYVEKLSYRYAQPDTAISYVVRPQLYAAGPGNKPGVSLLSENRLITLSGKGVLTVDIADEHIKFPANGMFIALEIIAPVDKNGNVLSAGKILPIPYSYWYTEQNSFYLRVDNIHQWSSLEKFADSNKFMNYPFGVSIRCIK